MYSKFKVTSAPNAFSTHFPLAEVYEAEICRLRKENQLLVTQLNEALAQLHRKQAENAPFKASQKAFFELSRAARNNKKRRIRDLVTKSLKGLDEFVPIEVCSFFPLTYFKSHRILLLIDTFNVIFP